MNNYYILDVKESRRSDLCLWWRPDNKGYTTKLDSAGRYTEEQVMARNTYYNDGEDAIAVLCEYAESFAVRAVPSYSNTVRDFKAMASTVRVEQAA